jgi:hypothetical protein
MSPIEWLQHWYRAQCNDEWEHPHGISIEALDNPGWLVKIDLTGTALEGRTMPAVQIGEINHSGISGNHDWIDCQVQDGRFLGAGGPFALLKICEVFQQWAERPPSTENASAGQG